MLDELLVLGVFFGPLGLAHQRLSKTIRVRAINEGDVHRYLTKPCDVVRLAMVIGRALDELDDGCDARQAATAPGA